MTTKVTVDAHAGWPVLVIVTDTYGSTTEMNDHVVQPGEVRDFYITDTRKVEVREMPKRA